MMFTAGAKARRINQLHATRFQYWLESIYRAAFKSPPGDNGQRAGALALPGAGTSEVVLQSFSQTS